jgi:hypothetical protein
MPSVSLYYTQTGSRLSTKVTNGSTCTTPKEKRKVSICIDAINVCDTHRVVLPWMVHALRQVAPRLGLCNVGATTTTTGIPTHQQQHHQLLCGVDMGTGRYLGDAVLPNNTGTDEDEEEGGDGTRDMENAAGRGAAQMVWLPNVTAGLDDYLVFMYPNSPPPTTTVLATIFLYHAVSLCIDGCRIAVLCCDLPQA